MASEVKAVEHRHEIRTPGSIGGGSEFDGNMMMSCNSNDRRRGGWSGSVIVIGVGRC